MTKMKPFDLQKALAGEPVVQRDGVIAKVLFHNEYSKLILCIYDEDNDGKSWDEFWCHENGRFVESEESAMDLFMAPSTKKLWIAVAKNYFLQCGCEIKRKVSPNFKTKEEMIDFGWAEDEFHHVEIEVEE